jgi:hypothetical protein
MSNEYENRIDYWDNKIIVDQDGNVTIPFYRVWLYKLMGWTYERK